MKNYLSVMSLYCLLFSGCVSLKTPKKTNLVPLNAPQLIGKYPATILKEYTGNGKTQQFTDILWYHFKNSPSSDSLELKQATHMELELTDAQHVTSRLYKGDILLKTDVIKGRLKNGYFRKKNHFSMKGIPPFYWSTTSVKVQFGTDTQKQLLIHHAQETSGGFLIMLAGTPGTTRTEIVPPYIKP